MPPAGKTEASSGGVRLARDSRSGLRRVKLARRCDCPCPAERVFASEDSSHVNAVELMVDGGATGAPFGAPIIQDVFRPLGSEAKLAKAHAD